jgi:uncharacterized membrane protein
MKFLRIVRNQGLAKPVFALVAASVICTALVAYRIIAGAQIRHAYLVWNLFLAWLPLVFAVLAVERYNSNGATRDRKFLALGVAWLLFFPNAPYIFTDVIHLTNRYFAHFWVDLMLILLCALTGLVLGFVSLYLMQSVVVQMFGRVASWLFIAAVAAVSSFGVYLGRFVRVNSWDIVTRPVKLYHGINDWASDPFAHATSFAFPALFATFLFITYLMLYALTHLPQAHQMAASFDRKAEA